MRGDSPANCSSIPFEKGQPPVLQSRFQSDGKKIPYDVMLVAKDGSATVYQKYEGNNL
jgi:hypothetical protein